MDSEIKLDFEYKKLKMYEKMKDDTRLVDMKMYSFTKALIAWCKAMKYHMNAHKNGGRDRRNGVDYIKITM